MLVEQKYQTVLAVIGDGRQVTDVARQFGVSRQTLHAWLGRYEADGLAGLAPRSRRPASCPHQMDAAVEVLVLEMRRANPHWGPRRLLHELERRSVSPMPSRSGVYRALVRAGVIEVEPRRSRREHWRRWERGSPMELWQLDLVGGFLLADGSRAKALTAIDDHSRFCVSAALMPRERTQPVCDAFAASLRAHGVPQQVLTDNGRVFTGRFNHPPVEVLFDRTCRENGIEHLLTAPRSPTTPGKIERFHRTLRAEFLTGRVFPTLARAQAEFDAWVAAYNHDRPHQSLGIATPGSRFLEPAADRDQPILDALAQDRTSDEWVSRLVAANGVVSVAWQQISVGVHSAGHRVDVHVADRVLEIWDGPELLKTVQRTTGGEVRKKNAKKQHARDECQHRLVALDRGAAPATTDHRFVGQHHLDRDAAFVRVHPDHDPRNLLVHDVLRCREPVMVGRAGHRYLEQSNPFLSLSCPEAPGRRSPIESHTTQRGQPRMRATNPGT